MSVAVGWFPVGGDMDPRDFDRLARSAASGVSRRGILAWLGRGGAASVLGAAGLTAVQRDVNAATATPPAPGTCTLHVTADIRLGPSSTQHLTPKNAKPGEFRGELSFRPDAKGAVKNGVFLVADGTKYAVNGQIVGSALDLRIAISKDRAVILTGVGAQDLGVCAGAVDGLFTGPQAGDLGDWHATATLTPAATTTGAVGATGPAKPPGAAPTATAATTAAPAGCPTGRKSCAGTCVDTQNDAHNCGACGTACGANQSCVAGACLQTGCPQGQTSCSADTADCVDLTSDVNNCGACGTACAADESCCASVCASLQNESNCGACGVVCAQDQSCQNGQCVAAGCPGGTVCGGVCTDLGSDPNNCGACGTACGDGTACLNSVCGACPNGQQVCGQVCVDITTDPNNCGNCGTACGDNQTCINFTCCDNSNICGGVCIGVGSPENCQGNCVPCAQGEMCCGVDIGCIDVSSDPNHCGDCNNACAQGQTCVNGACQ